jgi:hypothetical protein
MGNIAKREREISDISDRLPSCKGDSVHLKIQSMSAAAKVPIKDLHELLNGDGCTGRAAETR